MPKEKSVNFGKESEKSKSLESWIWDGACSIRGAKPAPKYKDFILPLIFTRRPCDAEADARETDRALKENVLTKLGVSA